MKRALLVTYGGGHAQIGLELLPHLERAGYETTILGLTTARAVYEPAGYSVLGFSDFIEPGDEGALADGEALAGETTAHPWVTRLETVAYLGLSYADLEAKYGEEGAAMRYAEHGRQCFLPMGVMARVFDRVQPELVLATNSPRAEEAALRLAMERGVASVCIGDLFLTGEESRLAVPGYGDRICVMSESVKEYLVGHGRPAAEIVVTGNPVFDRLFDPELMQDGRAIRASWNVGETPVVLWASQPDPQWPELGQEVAQHLEGVCERQGWQLAVRPHPNEPGFREALGESVIWSTRLDALEPLLHAVDAVVTVSSTVGLQAVIARKRLVQLDAPVSFLPAGYAELGLAERSDGIRDLERALTAALSGPGVPESLLPPAGQSSGRVMDVIASVVRQRA